MSDLKHVNRQWPLTAVVRITFEDLTADGSDALTGLPGNAIVVGGELTVQTAWNSATTAALNVGDADVADRYAAAVDLKATGRTALSLTGHQTSVPGDILGAFTETGDAATAGEAVLIVTYVVEGRGNEVQY